MDSTIELQVGVPDEFDYVCIFFNSRDDEFVPIDNNISFSFDISHEFDLIDCYSLNLGDIESSMVNSILVINIVEDIEVGNSYTKVNRIKHFFLYFLNMIMVLLILRDNKFS